MLSKLEKFQSAEELKVQYVIDNTEERIEPFNPPNYLILNTVTGTLTAGKVVRLQTLKWRVKNAD